MKTAREYRNEVLRRLGDGLDISTAVEEVVVACQAETRAATMAEVKSVLGVHIDDLVASR
jgi:hypothetical protein